MTSASAFIDGVAAGDATFLKTFPEIKRSVRFPPLVFLKNLYHIRKGRLAIQFLQVFDCVVKTGVFQRKRAG